VYADNTETRCTKYSSADIFLATQLAWNKVCRIKQVVSWLPC